MEIEKNSSTYNQIEKAIKYIDENFKSHPSIDEIAKNVGMSKYHFIRVFKDYVGLTPQQFLHSVTLNYAKEHIKESKSILDSSLDIGLSSSSRLHELFVNLIGVTPKEWKEKGKDVEITYGFGQTPFGEALIGFTSKGICYLGFCDNNKKDIFQRFNELWENANLVFNEKLGGIKGFVTNDFTLTANEIIEHYNNQYEVERAFRIYKTDLKIRPIYHRLETRIKAHILISFVSYAIYKEFDRKLKINDVKFNFSQKLLRKIIEHLIAIKIDDEIIPINPSEIQKQILDIL